MMKKEIGLLLTLLSVTMGLFFPSFPTMADGSDKLNKLRTPPQPIPSPAQTVQIICEKKLNPSLDSSPTIKVIVYFDRIKLEKSIVSPGKTGGTNYSASVLLAFNPKTDGPPLLLPNQTIKWSWDRDPKKYPLVNIIIETILPPPLGMKYNASINGIPWDFFVISQSKKDFGDWDCWN